MSAANSTNESESLHCDDTRSRAKILKQQKEQKLFIFLLFKTKEIDIN